MKMYLEKGLILPGEGSEGESNQTKENWTNKKDLPTYLTTEEKAQWGGGRSYKPRETEGPS